MYLFIYLFIQAKEKTTTTVTTTTRRLNFKTVVPQILHRFNKRLPCANVYRIVVSSALHGAYINIIKYDA